MVIVERAKGYRKGRVWKVLQGLEEALAQVHNMLRRLLRQHYCRRKNKYFFLEKTEISVIFLTRPVYINDDESFVTKSCHSTIYFT